MAGFVGTVEQWRIVDDKLATICQNYIFKIFHATDFARRKGEFKGWSNQKRIYLISDLMELVRDYLTEGITIHLEHERYMNEYKKGPIPKKMSLDTHYGVCFRGCVAHLFHLLFNETENHTLDIVLEYGHKDAGDCKTIFTDAKKRMERRRGINFLGRFERKTKKEEPRLMLADFLAYTYSDMRASAAAGGLDYKAEAPEPSEGQAGLTFLELLPDALEGLKRDFEQDRQDLARAWATRQTARKSKE